MNRPGLCTVILALAACGGDVDTTALFELPGSSLGFYAHPFPSDVRLLGDGRIDMTGYPDVNALITDYVTAISASQRGFSVAAPIFFRFDGPLDSDSLPANGEASLGEDASVYLVNVDSDSPRYRARVPVLLRFETRRGESIGDNWLSVLPYPGFVLEDATTYSVIVTDRVRDIDGAPVRSSRNWLAMKTVSVPDDPDLARAQQIYSPLWTYLDTSGSDERADVVSAAVFTTQSTTVIMQQLRDVIYSDVAAPAARQISRVISVPEYNVYDGLFDGPNFQTGLPPYSRVDDGGEIALDDGGVPILQRMEELRFSVSVPPGPVPAAGWPVVVYAHGTGGNYRSYQSNGTAARLAAEGVAVISMDQVLHGPRNPGSSPEIAFFNFQNPYSARDNPLQGALDDFQLVRLAVGFGHMDPDDGRTHRFDPDNISFFGHSQGGVTGTPFVAYEPQVKGAVLSGTGGLLYVSLLNKTEPIDIASLVHILVPDDPLDEFNPILALLQMWMDHSDSASYARYVALQPAAGNLPKHVFLSLGHTDRFTPIPSIQAIAVALGVVPVEPVSDPIEGMALAGRTATAAPVTGNVNGVTAGLLEYDEAPGSDGHFVLFDVPAARAQSIQFLGTLAKSGRATIVAPQ